MPELPEVEHARRSLSRWLGASDIVRATVSDLRILKPRLSAAVVDKALRGRRVKKIERRGKWLRIVLVPAAKKPTFLYSHLGMTGKWVLAPSPEAVRFEKLRLVVEKTGCTRNVCYLDPRLFGRLFLASEDPPEWTSLGPDPLHDGIDVDQLAAKLARRSAPIKPTLLDQTVLAGVGNIQATEALFDALIDPRRPAHSLGKKEVTAVARGIEKSIARTLLAQKGPLITYVEEVGAENPFIVYERGGEPCPRCGRPLRKIFLAGRGTVFCPHCQR